MNYIILEPFEKLNVTFNGVSREKATQILRFECPPHKMLAYCCLFDSYKSTKKKGQLINVDFEQLCKLKEIDEIFSNLLLVDFLETEIAMKARLLSDCADRGVSEFVVRQYVKTDEEYILTTYTAENRQILTKYRDKKIDELDLAQFLEAIQFGTFERLYNYVYNVLLPNEAKVLSGQEYVQNKIKSFGQFFPSARRLRNIVAHYEPLIPYVKNQGRYAIGEVVHLLRKGGIGEKSLSTNLKKSIVSDYVNFRFLSKSMQSDECFRINKSRTCDFIKTIKDKYSALYKNNSLLKSLFQFFVAVNEIV